MKSISGRLAGLVFVLAALCGCTSIPRPEFMSGVQIEKGKPFEIMSRPAHGGGAPMYPTVWNMPDGTLFVKAATGSKISRDMDATWTNAPEDMPRRGLRGTREDVQLLRSDIAVFEGTNMVWRLNRLVDGRSVKNEDKVLVYDVPSLASEGKVLSMEVMTAGAFWPNNRSVVLTNGTVLLTAFTRYKNDDRTRVVLISSTNDLKSFNYVSTVATGRDASWGLEGPNESALALLPDGSLFCVMRTGSKRSYGPFLVGQAMLQARSLDGGRTWTDRRKMALAGVNPMMTVLNNGIIAVGAGRPGNMISFSGDNGNSWTWEDQLSGTDVGTSGYLDLTALDDEHVLVVYEMHSTYLTGLWLFEPPPKKDYVMGCIFRVRPKK